MSEGPPINQAPTLIKGSRRVLLLTYTFPPVGGAGVQRVTKFVKYLPRHGWEVSVLTVANPSVPLYDNSLGRDVPEGTIVRRARSWEPSYGFKASVSAGESGTRKTGSRLKRFLGAAARTAGTLLLQPDPQVLWLPGAVAEGKRLLRRTRHDAILASGPPFSTFLTAARLSRFARLPLVLDYRDEWGISNAVWENKRLGPVSRYLQGRMQARVVRAAKGLMATTRCSADTLDAVRASCGSRAKVTWIYNGYDADDFVDQPAEPTPGGRFRIAYVGTLWNLTSVAPLVDAVRLLTAQAPELSSDLELVFAGRRTGPQDEHIARLRGLPCTVAERPYIDHSSAVALMKSCAALCLLLSDLPGAGRVVPAKLFEYMAARRPILAIGPPGETADLLKGYPGAACFEPRDIEGIAGWLFQAIRAHRSGEKHSSGDWDASAYDRDNEARQLSEFLDVVGR